MKNWIFFTILFLFLYFAPKCGADPSYDDIRGTINRGASYDEIQAIENKYNRVVISGEGYVLLVKEAETVKGYDVHAVDDGDPKKMAEKILGDVSIIIPGGSPFAKVAKDLKKGQKIKYSGSVSSIFGKTLVLKGSTEIWTEE